MHESWHDYINASFATGKNVRKRDYLPKMFLELSGARRAQVIWDDIADEIRSWYAANDTCDSAVVLVDRRLLAFLLWHMSWEKVSSLGEIAEGWRKEKYSSGLSISPVDWPFNYSTGFILPGPVSNTALSCPDFSPSSN